MIPLAGPPGAKYGFPVKHKLRSLAAALLFAVPFGSTGEASSYVIDLQDETGLDPAQFSIYAMGFSVSSSLVMDSDGTFVSQNSGTISSYKVGAGGLTQITLDAATALVGGRFYFFIAPASTPAPSVAFGTQPSNPPDSAFPPFSIVELTVPAPAGNPPVNQNATVDIQTVDGFIFPITLTLDGQTNVAGQQYGQPLGSDGQVTNRAAILNAFTTFMQNEGSAGQGFLDLKFAAPSIAGQDGGILNPGAFLTTVDATNQFVNLTSPLNSLFDTVLQTVFSSNSMSVQGVNSNPAGIVTQPYAVTATTHVYPGTSVTLPALQFQNGPDTFYIYSPLGLAVLTDDQGDAITGQISTSGQPPTASVLTLDAAASALEVGMYVSGAGLSPANGASTTQIAAINGNEITLNQSVGNVGKAQYRFCKLPFLVMFQTPGQMVFANSGVFADSTIQYAADPAAASVLGNLENQLVSALNRGVANHASALNPASPGGTSEIWGDQRTWYPPGVPQNLFSLFMHAGQISGVPIFFRPLDAGTWPNARGQVMGSAYGFAFDENGGPIPPAPVGQPEVPSKFDQNIVPGSSMAITFGPWAATPTPPPTPPAPPITPTPAAPPTLKVNGKKTIRTSAKNVKIKGSTSGQTLFVKYRKRQGKTVTSRVRIKPNGQWIFKFQPKLKKTVLKFYSTDPDGLRSPTRKTKVIDSRN